MHAMAIDRVGEGACDIGRPVAVIARFDARPSDEQCHQRAALGQQGKPAVAQQAPLAARNVEPDEIANLRVQLLGEDALAEAAAEEVLLPCDCMH